jgi:aminocarboxymuconate-semialdehyde decarboxylase
VSADKKLVDYQTHWYPEAYFKSILDRVEFPRAKRLPEGGYYLEMKEGGWEQKIPQVMVDLDLQFADIDELGVDTMVSTPSIIGEVGFMELGAAKEAIALINEESARAQKEHPDHFIGTAMLPVQDIEASIEALDRSVELGLTAVCLLSNRAGHPLCDDETLPLFKRIEEHGMPIIFHPANHTLASASGIDPVGELGVGWMFDTTAAALSLISTRTLDECPNLEVLHPHVGGVLPFIDGRLDVVVPMWGPVEVDHPLHHYLRTNFMTDSVSQTAGSLQLGIDTYGVDRVLFGSDYPWMPLKKARPYVEDNVAAADAEKILFENQMPFVRKALGI